MKRRYIILIVLLLYTAIIFLPPLMYGYVYPNNGDDSALHLVSIDALKRGEDIGYAYLGRQIVGYPMIWISELLGVSIDTQFLWFNYIVLWLVGIAVFALLAKVVNWKAGLLAIPLVMFCTPSVFNLFDTGAIFDLLTVGVILPLAILGLAYSITSRKLYWIVPTVVMAGLAVVVHSMGVFNAHLANIEPSPAVSEFISIFLGYPILIALLVILAVVIYKRRDIKLGIKGKMVLAVFGILVLGMIPLAFWGITSWATRFAIDLAIVLAVFTAFLLGMVVKLAGKTAIMVVTIFVLGSSIPILTTYYQYNSAVKPVDLEAIRYMNTLPSKYFSCSPEVEPLIYSRFLNKTYKKGALPYIERNEPMTSWTTPGTRDYWWGHNPIPDVPLDNAVKFSDDGLKIYVVD